ncbi:hypothetical protein FB451DRAFT_1411334 [Mycena latifolia]|nr:hypothetical protein FB451DRAFT_1411334 [Mycena latifolia]
MFQPFDNASQFYPGLIVWCNPNCYEMDLSTLGPDEIYDRRKARELCPCLIVAVDHTHQTFQVARLCATTPRDTRRWVRVDSAPPITWRLTNAWIWVATPPTISMVFNNHKVMHPHKDIYYTTNPIAASNLQNYWVHRNNYLSWHPAGSISDRRGTWSTSQQASSSTNTMILPYIQPPNSTVYSTNPTLHLHPQSPPGQVNLFNQGTNVPASNAYPGSSFHPASGYGQTQAAFVPAGNVYPGSSFHPASGYGQTQAPFNTLSAQSVVVPLGFAETHSGAPGWWRNPETGWFWHASCGLLPRDSQR